MKKLYLAFFMSLLVPFLGAAELDILKTLEFKARPDLAGSGAPKLISEPTTGVVIQQTAGDASAAYEVKKTTAGTVKIAQAGLMGQTSKMFYTANLPQTDLNEYKYFYIRLKAFGIKRNGSPTPLFKCKDVEIMASSTVFNDRREHTYAGKLAQTLPAGGELTLLLETDNSGVEFEILEFKLTSDLAGDPDIFQAAVDKDFKGYKTVDLSKYFNSDFPSRAQNTIKQHKLLVDYPAFPGSKVKLGVPFKLGENAKNLVMPPNNQSALNKTVTRFGATIKNSFFPRARLDEVVIPVSGKTPEIYLLMATWMRTDFGRYATTRIPAQIADTDCFNVQIDYTDGSSDMSMPRNIGADGFVLQGAVGAYAVITDPTRELKAVRLQNRSSVLQAGLAALTLNNGGKLMIGEELRNPPAEKFNQGVAVKDRNLKIRRNKQRTVFENSHYQLVINTDDQFNIEKIVNYHAPEMAIKIASGGLEVHRGNQVFSGASFRVVSAKSIPNGVKYVLKSKAGSVPLTAEVTVSGSANDELKFSAVLRNTSGTDFSTAVRFPVLNNIVLGTAADTFYYYPKTRAVASAASGGFLTPIHERAYHVQFMDIYNPVAGGGIALHTRDRSKAIFDFGLSKKDSGVSFYINHPGNWNTVKAGSALTLPETVLQFHGGDWRQAMNSYCNWVKSWFNPYPVNLPQQWHDLFYLRQEYMRRYYGWSLPFMDKETKKYHYEEIKDITRAFMDQEGDIYHFSFWNWPADAGDKFSNNSNFDDGEYNPENYAGGGDQFKALIEKIHSEGKLVSLYTIATYLARNTRLGKEIGAKICQVPRGGKGMVANDMVYFPCLEQWQDQYAQAIARAQDYLKVDAVYLDCYPFGRNTNTCYGAEHGHEVPMQLNRTQHEMLKKIRQALPGNVAIWTEDPSIDYDAEYLNGNITYYYTTINEHRAKSFDINDAAGRDFFLPVQNIQRFTLPHLKQIGFPCGVEVAGINSHDINALFFNGEGLYDVGWMMFNAHSRPRVRHWLKIQKALPDCFASLNIKPQVPTAVGGIFANEFVGKDRTAWTLWNGRYNTYRGKVLEVPHREGARYYDAWNVQEIQPEIRDGKALLSVSNLHPQGLGCVIQYTGDLPAGLPVQTVEEDEKTLIELN